MFILKFLQSLIVPSKMAKYRKMNVLLAIAVFVFSSGLLALPNSIAISKNRYKLVDEQDSYYLGVFTKLTAEDVLFIKESSANVLNRYLALEDEAKVNMGTPYIRDVNYNDENVQIYIVFDVYELYNPESSPSYNIQESFDSLVDDGVDKYLLIFYPDGVYYRSPKMIKEVKYTKGDDYDFSSIDDGQALAYRLIDMYIEDIKMELTFNTFLMTVVYPLIFIILMWLIYKTTATPYAFKEMYNLAAIASILPLLVIIGLAFLFPNKPMLYYYISGFGLYYIIVLYTVSKNKKLT